MARGDSYGVKESRMGKKLQRITQVVNPRTGELVVEADVDLPGLAKQLVATAANHGIELTGRTGC